MSDKARQSGHRKSKTSVTLATQFTFGKRKEGPKLDSSQRTFLCNIPLLKIDNEFINSCNLPVIRNVQISELLLAKSPEKQTAPAL